MFGRRLQKFRMSSWRWDVVSSALYCTVELIWKEFVLCLFLLPVELAEYIPSQMIASLNDKLSCVSVC